MEKDIIERLYDISARPDCEYSTVLYDAVTEIERLRAALRDAYEVYAGSEGFIAETCAESYRRQIIKKMVDCISAALSGDKFD